MRAVIVFTIAYTVALYAYGSSVDSPLTGIYTGINVGLFVLFGVLHIWARWPIHSLWSVSLVGLGNMLGGVLLVDGNALYMAEVLGPIRYDKLFHAVAAGAMVVVAWEAMKRWSDGVRHRGGPAATANPGFQAPLSEVQRPQFAGGGPSRATQGSRPR